MYGSSKKLNSNRCVSSNICVLACACITQRVRRVLETHAGGTETEDTRSAESAGHPEDGTRQGQRHIDAGQRHVELRL